MKILISGAGIAGPTLAFWLLRYGYEVTIVERAQALRTGGYVIDFWGAGFEVANRMGLVPLIREAGYSVQQVKVVNRSGQTVASFPAANFARAANGQYTTISRGDLAAILFRAVQDRCETRFADSVTVLKQDEHSVRVGFEDGGERDFDIVVGADGLHSCVRTIAFGTELTFERYLGLKVAAFAADGYEPREELTFFMYNEPGVQIARFAMREGKTMFLFIYRDPDPDIPHSPEAQKVALREHFGHCGWETPRILDAMDGAGEFYFDRVSQIRMDRNPGLWTRGRVTLLGDAAAAPSFLAGQGTALAMVGAYILAGELHRAHGDHSAAFAAYQDLFAPFMKHKQDSALRFSGSFAPKTNLGIWTRDLVMNLMKLPGVTELVAGRGLMDKITLPEY